MSFECTLWKDVIYKDAECQFERVIVLPFAPTENILLMLDHNEITGGEPFSIDAIEFYVEDGGFILFDYAICPDGEDPWYGCGCRPKDNCCTFETALAQKTHPIPG